MKRWLILLLWLGAVLFPYTWLRARSPHFRLLIDAFFSSETAHIVGHLFLFAALSGLFWWAVRRRPGWLGSAFTLAAAFPIGFMQESLQLMSRRRGFGSPEAFDLLVDLAGVVIGLLLARWWLPASPPETRNR